MNKNKQTNKKTMEHAGPPWVALFVNALLKAAVAKPHSIC